MHTSSPPRHLLVRLPNPLGDVVLATPALRGLRRALPRTRISWTGRPAALRALEGLDDRDAILPVAGPFAGEGLAPWRAGRLWRRTAPDAVLLLPHSWSSGIAARVSGATRRVGWGGRGRALLLTESVVLPAEGGALVPRSMVRMYLDLAHPFGAEDDGEGPRVTTTGFDRRRADRRLKAFGAMRPFFAVNPGAAYGPSKVYPPARLAEVVRLVREQEGLLPLLLCGPGEAELARETAEQAGGPVLSTHDDPPDLGELKALLARAAVLLTTDAGPRHLAEALGTPTVVWMGPTDPRWTEGSRAIVVRANGVPCLGCHRTTCPIEHPCMEKLEPERLAAAAARALAAPAPPPSAGNPPSGPSE